MCDYDRHVFSSHLSRCLRQTYSSSSVYLEVGSESTSEYTMHDVLRSMIAALQAPSGVRKGGRGAARGAGVGVAGVGVLDNNDAADPLITLGDALRRVEETRVGVSYGDRKDGLLFLFFPYLDRLLPLLPSLLKLLPPLWTGKLVWIGVTDSLSPAPPLILTAPPLHYPSPAVLFDFVYERLVLKKHLPLTMSAPALCALYASFQQEDGGVGGFVHKLVERVRVHLAHRKGLMIMVGQSEWFKAMKLTTRSYSFKDKNGEWEANLRILLSFLDPLDLHPTPLFLPEEDPSSNASTSPQRDDAIATEDNQSVEVGSKRPRSSTSKAGGATARLHREVRHVSALLREEAQRDAVVRAMKDIIDLLVSYVPLAPQDKALFSLPALYPVLYDPPSSPSHLSPLLLALRRQLPALSLARATNLLAALCKGLAHGKGLASITSPLLGKLVHDMLDLVQETCKVWGAFLRQLLGEVRKKHAQDDQREVDRLEGKGLEELASLLPASVLDCNLAEMRGKARSSKKLSSADEAGRTKGELASGGDKDVDKSFVDKGEGLFPFNQQLSFSVQPSVSSDASAVVQIDYAYIYSQLVEDLCACIEQVMAMYTALLPAPLEGSGITCLSPRVERDILLGEAEELRKRWVEGGVNPRKFLPATATNAAGGASSNPDVCKVMKSVLSMGGEGSGEGWVSAFQQQVKQELKDSKDSKSWGGLSEQDVCKARFLSALYTYEKAGVITVRRKAGAEGGLAVTKDMVQSLT
eukprot:gene29259-35319_t